MNKKHADQTHHKLCQRISKLNKIDVCLHSSSHKQAVYEFDFFGVLFPLQRTLHTPVC